jgi:hypothetical protein
MNSICLLDYWIINMIVILNGWLESYGIDHLARSSEKNEVRMQICAIPFGILIFY